jgi:hypothetical protein
MYISKANSCKFIVQSLSVTSINVNPTSGVDNGTITVVVSGGTAPYLYSINRGVQQSSNQFTGLATGKYLIQVLDRFGKIGYLGIELFENVDCGDYSGSTVQDIIDTGLKVANFYNCTVNSFY